MCDRDKKANKGKKHIFCSFQLHFANPIIARYFILISRAIRCKTRKQLLRPLAGSTFAQNFTPPPKAVKMSTTPRRTTLQDLPIELVESLLVVQPPATVCAVACTSRALSSAVNSPYLWRSVARRTLRVEATTAAELRAHADHLVCAWWAAAGALVHGVPVHFRRRFTAVRARGAATLVRVRASSDDAAFAMGCADDLAGAHAPPPALEMDFAFASNSAFPVDGMVARIVGAPVPAATQPRSPPVSPTRSPRTSPPSSPRFGMRSRTLAAPRLPRASALRAAGARRRAEASASAGDAVYANARILLNGELIATHHLNKLCTFSWIDVKLPANLLRIKPQMNTLTVEYDAGASNAAYWLMSVRLVPAMLPMPEKPSAEENVPLRHVKLSSHDAMHALGSFGDLDSFVHKKNTLTIRTSSRRNHAYSPFQRLNLGC